MQTNKQDRTMNNLHTHYPVNWIDGMKLSSSHFAAVQDFVTDSVRDAIALIRRNRRKVTEEEIINKKTNEKTKKTKNEIITY